MRSLLVLFLIMESGSALAQELPKKAFMEPIPLNEISIQTEINVKASFEIPKGYKASFSPQLDIYEHHEGGWKLITSIKEDRLPLFRTKNLIQFNSPVRMTKADSEVAFDLSVAFCSKKCVINNFQGRVKRSAKAKTGIVQFDLKGFLPEDKISPEFQLNKKSSKTQKPG